MDARLSGYPARKEAANKVPGLISAKFVPHEHPATMVVDGSCSSYGFFICLDG